MAKVIEYFNPSISSKNGFISAINDIHPFGSKWVGELGDVGVEALDSMIRLKIGEREVFKAIGEPNVKATYNRMAHIIMSYNYQLDGLYELLIPNDRSELGYNPLDNVFEVRHEETDTDFDKGEDTVKFEKGEESISFEKGEESVKFNKGQDTITFDKGEENITLDMDDRKSVTKNPERTDSQTTSESTTAFDSSDYDKATDKSVNSTTYGSFNVETTTDGTTDVTTNGSRTDTTTNGAREDNTTNSSREDNTTNSAREDNTTNSARHDDTKTVYDVTRHGNIGTTTSFDLIGGDRKLHYYNFFNDVIDVIEREMLASCLWEV